MTWSAVLPILLFLLEYFKPSDTLYSVLSVVRLKHDDRPSGLASEPSSFAAWIAFVWPMMLFATLSARSTIGRVGAAIMLMLAGLSAYLSNARTVVAILALQILYYGYWRIRQVRDLSGRVRTLLIVAGFVSLFMLVLADRLLSITDPTGGSNIARLAYTATGINVFLYHPLIGIGIGQFGHFFVAYVPDFALLSEEVATYATGAAEYRASTFNLFVRLLCEFGLPIGLVLSWVVVRPLIAALQSQARQRFCLYAALSAVGGVGFWLSQDQYGYQPGILSLAILATALSNKGFAGTQRR